MKMLGVGLLGLGLPRLAIDFLRVTSLAVGDLFGDAFPPRVFLADDARRRVVFLPCRLFAARAHEKREHEHRQSQADAYPDSVRMLHVYAFPWMVCQPRRAGTRTPRPGQA